MANSSNGVRWKEPSIIIGVLGLGIALLAFGRDLFGFELFPQTQTAPTPRPEATSHLPTSTNSPGPATATTPGAKSASSGSPLTNLTPKVGGSWIQRRASTEAILDMACATNTDGDTYRAVHYAIPPRYVAFHARVAPSGVVGDVRVDIRVDNVIRSGVTLRPNQPDADVSAAVMDGTTLELRLTCGKPGGKVTFSNAILTN